MKKVTVLFLSFLTIIITLSVLFYRSVEIGGDIPVYLLGLSEGVFSEYYFEPLFGLFFYYIHLFPSEWAINILLCSFAILAFYPIYYFRKHTGFAIFTVFYLICVVPFAFAINLRVGLGIFLMVFFYKSRSLRILLPMFSHISFTSLLSTFSLKLKYIFFIFLLILLFVLVFGNQLLIKYNHYFAFMASDISFWGICTEISVLFSLYCFLDRVTITCYNDKIVFSKVFKLLLLLSALLITIPPVASRLVTLSYIPLSFCMLDKKYFLLKKNVKYFLLSVLPFIGIYFFLCIFRMYRVLTMFGFLDTIFYN